MSMNSAYKTTAKIFEHMTRLRNAPLAAQLKAIKKGELVVVEGDHDHIELLLDKMKLPYHLMQSDDLAEQMPGRVMFVNCRNYDLGGDNEKKAVRNFASRGGRVVSTDWSLSLISQAFPGHLYKTDEETEDDVVEIRPQTNLARQFIGLDYTQCHPKWWLEGSSHIYRINKNKVIDLFTSGEMKDRYGQNHVAVAFPYQAGEVFHFISHLELQRTNQRTSQDKGSLDDFLKKIELRTLGELGADVNFAELEAAYSTLNTLAYLCAPAPLLTPVSYDGKSVLSKKAGSGSSVKAKGLI